MVPPPAWISPTRPPVMPWVPASTIWIVADTTPHDSTVAPSSWLATAPTVPYISLPVAKVELMSTLLSSTFFTTPPVPTKPNRPMPAPKTKFWCMVMLSIV